MSNPMMGNVLKLYDTLKAENIKAARFYWVSEGCDFWREFFGCRDFLDVNPAEWDIPTVIVSSGIICGYDIYLGDLEYDAEEHLLRVGQMCGIKILFPWK
jgi:hypothetical protein